jgi:hypothetical protein
LLTTRPKSESLAAQLSIEEAHSVPEQQVTAKAESESGLEAQLDQLMAQIAQQAPGATPGTSAAPEKTPARAADPATASAPSATSASGPAASDHTTIPSTAVQPGGVTAAVASEPVGAVEPEPDLVGHALASQIQELLDDAADQQKQAESKAVPAETQEAQGASTAAATPTDSSNPRPGNLAPVASSATPAAPVDPVEQEVLHQIDDHLAQEADNAVAGDFETVHEVLAQGEGTNALPSTEASQSGSVNPAAPANSVSGGAIANRATQQSSVAPHGGAAPAGTQQLPTLTERNPTGATAADVARELDEQPETAHSASAAAAVSNIVVGTGNAARPITSPTSSTAVVSRSQRNLLAPVQGASRTFRRILAAVNGPLARFSPDTRANIGYVGVVVMFSGAVLLSYAIWHSHR